MLILAVKPQSIRQVLEQLRPSLTAEHLVVSIAAGITIASIARRAGRGTSASSGSCPIRPPSLERVPRPSHSGRDAHSEDEAVVRTFLNSVGHAVCVAKSLLDAVTGFSGSGPAFVYLMVEGISMGACGWDYRERGPLLAAQTSWAPRKWCWRPACTRRPQGSGCLTGRHDDRASCVGAGLCPRRVDRRRRGRNQTLVRVVALAAPSPTSSSSEVLSMSWGCSRTFTAIPWPWRSRRSS